jgi:hypothetical protein
MLYGAVENLGEFRGAYYYPMTPYRSTTCSRLVRNATIRVGPKACHPVAGDSAALREKAGADI